MVCPANVPDCDRACKCDNGCMKHPKALCAKPCCAGNACTYGCGTCFCYCHDCETCKGTGMVALNALQDTDCTASLSDLEGCDAHGGAIPCGECIKTLTE